MAIKSGFFNSINGDRKYDAKWFAEYFASFIGNGIFPNPSTNLQVVEGGNMKTIIRSGKAWINGYFLSNDSDYVLTHDNADGVLKRIDRIVLRLNYVARQIEIVIKKGTFASSPTAPTLQRDNDMFELALAEVLINNGSTQITQTNITDLRLNNSLCGIVHGTVNQIDTTTLFNQYQSWYEQMTGQKLNEYDAWFAQHQQEFEDWFLSIQGILEGDVASNLLLLIQQNQSDIRSLIKIKKNITIQQSSWAFNGITSLYEYQIIDVEITEDSIVDINIQLTSLDSAKMLLSACNSSNGTVTLYASSLPDTDLIVDYRITNEVV